MTLQQDQLRHQANREIIWQVISFFAADAEVQIQGLGACSYDYFYSRDDYFNLNENYLVGLYIVYVMLWGDFKDYEDFSIDEQSQNYELKAQLDLMYWASEKRVFNFWTRQALLESPIWRIVRKIANKLLSDAGLPPKFPHVPLCIEEIAEPPTDPSIIDML